MTWDANQAVVGTPKDNRPPKQAVVMHPVVTALLVLTLLAILGLIVGVGYLAYNFLTLPQRVMTTTQQNIDDSVRLMRDKGAAVARRIRESMKFSPTVVVGDQVIEQGHSEVRHLVLRQMEFTQERLFTHTFLGSTKRLEVQGDFRARAGLDLSRQTRILVSEHRIVVELPEPEVLTVELEELKFIRDNDGLWNRIRPEERQEHLNILMSRARETAERLLPADEIKESARQMFSEILTPVAGMTVEVVFDPDAPHVSSRGFVPIRPMN